MRRRVDFARAPERRIVIKFQFRGPHKGHSTWWLKLDRGEADLCLTDPGGMDLTVEADLRSMIMVWMGDLPLRQALAPA